MHPQIFLGKSDPQYLVFSCSETLILVCGKLGVRCSEASAEFGPVYGATEGKIGLEDRPSVCGRAQGLLCSVHDSVK